MMNVISLACAYKDVLSLFKRYESQRTFPGGPPSTLQSGYWLMPWFPEVWPRIEAFPVREDDVVLLAFPKSGINWLHYICYLIETQNFDHNANCDMRVLEMPRAPDTLKAFAERAGPRLICSHLPPKFLPKTVFNGKVIYLYRNPKDTVVSLFHHYQGNVPLKSWGYDGSFYELADRFIEGKITWGPYDKHVNEFYELYKSGKPMLFLSYEQLKQDPMSTVRLIASFLEKELDQATLDRICTATSFEAMRANKAVNWSIFKRFGVWRRDREFIRKGQIGDWRNYFGDKELLRRFDKHFETSMAGELLAKCCAIDDFLENADEADERLAE